MHHRGRLPRHRPAGGLQPRCRAAPHAARPRCRRVRDEPRRADACPHCLRLGLRQQVISRSAAVDLPMQQRLRGQYSSTGFKQVRGRYRRGGEGYWLGILHNVNVKVPSPPHHSIPAAKGSSYIQLPPAPGAAARQRTRPPLTARCAPYRRTRHWRAPTCRERNKKVGERAHLFNTTPSDSNHKCLHPPT